MYTCDYTERRFYCLIQKIVSKNKMDLHCKLEDKNQCALLKFGTRRVNYLYIVKGTKRIGHKLM